MKAQGFAFRRANNYHLDDCKEASERYFGTGDIAQHLKAKTYTQNIKISFPREVLQVAPKNCKPCMVAHTFSLSTWVSQAGGSGVPEHSWLHRDFKKGLGYVTDTLSQKPIIMY